MEIPNDKVSGISTDNLKGAIDTYIELGYHLVMIKPADDPTFALMAKEDSFIRIHERRGPVSTKKGDITSFARSPSSGEWHEGRAGMMYRDLIPGRIAGKVIASHIKLLEDGPVNDYVHYHKVEFQMIYCLKGRIEVVYEDQGPPFWLEAGDCVVQPPEIRHRVLFAEGNAEVLELTMPAEHETWVDHDLELPNKTVDKARLFNGQRFVLTKDTNNRPS